MTKIFGAAAVVFSVALGCLSARGQATATASRSVELSVFAGGTGVFTGLLGGRNGSFTAGADIQFPAFYSFLPSIEVRGMLPVIKGQISSQKNLLGGIKLERHYGRFHPYGDVLYGRGVIDYQGLGVPEPTGQFNYLKSYSNVLSPGAGLDYQLTRNFAFKADVQFQKYSSPVTTSGTMWSKPVTFGLKYTIPIR